MTDEERQQAEAYIKLQDNVEELVGELVDKRINLIFLSKPSFIHTRVLDIVVDTLRKEPRSELGIAIANHVRLLNRENIK